MFKQLTTVTVAGALVLAAATPAGAAPANQTGCQQFGNYTLAIAGFDLGVKAVADHGDGARFVRPSRRSHGMVLCMAVNYNEGVAYSRGTRDLPLPVAGKSQSYIRSAYVAGLAQR